MIFLSILLIPLCIDSYKEGKSLITEPIFDPKLKSIITRESLSLDTIEKNLEKIEKNIESVNNDIEKVKEKIDEVEKQKKEISEYIKTVNKGQKQDLLDRKNSLSDYIQDLNDLDNILKSENQDWHNELKYF